MSREMPLFATHPIGFGQSQQAGMYRAFCVHVVDGDTFDVILDLGFMQYSLITVRLLGADTPELNASDKAERERANLARDRVYQLIFEQPLLIRTYKDNRSFGRYVAETWLSPRSNAVNSIVDLELLKLNDETMDWVSLAAILIQEKHTKKI